MGVEINPREAVVILRRLEGKTLKEIATEFNVTQARIRQIEQKAMKKLRHPGLTSKEEKHHAPQS